MAKIYRCPACGALWRVPDDLSEPRLQCSECHTTFSADKAEVVHVDDEKLEARLSALRSPMGLSATESQAEAVMSDIANSLSDFDSRTTPYIPPRRSGSRFGWLFSLIGFLVFLGILGEGALLGHAYVLEQVPVLKPVYEKVCRHVPCPGFAWSDAKAIRTTSSIATDPVNPHQSVISLTLINQSKVAQRLPLLELRLMDPAGDTMAQKLLEPGSYGLPANTILKPGQKALVTLTPDTPTPVQPSGVKITPVSDNTH